MGKMKNIVLEAGEILERKTGMPLDICMCWVMTHGTTETWEDYIKKNREES